MKTFIKSLYLNTRIFILLFACAVFFIFAYFFPQLLWMAKLAFFVVLGMTVLDLFLLYQNTRGIQAERVLPEKLSNSDDNPIVISLLNQYRFTSKVKIIDELPVQLQQRDFMLWYTLVPSEAKQITYTLRPTSRGEYHFGHLLIFASSPLGLIAKRYRFSTNAMVPSYPSFLQLRKYEFLAFSNTLKTFGLKKIRRIGNSMAFEQIKEYVSGDDVRHMNWKATAKKNEFMVNQFQDEKSQPIYSIIDTGRVMKMPFHQLMLLDYAINATLVISNIALKKHDKAGMFTFSRKVEHMIPAQRRKGQMGRIQETLYNISTDFVESDYARLFTDIKRKVTQRSVLLLYTNFETLDGLHRQLPYLQAIAKSHLLVVIFFKNEELEHIVSKKATNTQQIFEQTIAEKFRYEKKLIVNELRKHGMYAILTTPKNLTVNTINTYLEIKAKGLL